MDVTGGNGQKYANVTAASRLRSKIKLPGAAVFSSVSSGPRRTSTVKTTKTRTGCIECKRRRIKCDENQPICVRCVKARRQCSFSFAQNRAKLPARATITHFISATEDKILIEPSLNLSIFENQQQWNLFHKFRFTTIQAGTLPINTLSNFIPQIAQQESALRELCYAIGAASSAFLDPHSDLVADEKHYTTSLKHYNHAIRAVRQTISSGDQSLVSALVSILFVTYDMLRGDTKTALMHFIYGLHATETYFNRRRKETGLSMASLVLSDFESAVYDMFQRLITYQWDIEPSLADPELATGYRLVFECDSSKHRYRIKDMPPAFDGLPQALRWWDVVQHHILHHIEKMSSPIEGAHRPRQGDTWHDHDPFSILRSWYNKFEPLLQTAEYGREQAPDQYLSACILKALYLDAITDLHRRKRPIDILPDAKLLYMDITRTTRELARRTDWGSTQSMTVETVAIRPLVFVLAHCHDNGVRQEVKDVLMDLRESCPIARVLLAMLSKQRQLVPQKIKNIERSFGWDLTACGCNSGVLPRRIKNCQR